MNARVKNYDPDVAEAAVDNCIAGLDAMDEPEVHDCEFEPDITPWWHEPVIFLKWVGPLFFAIFALLYAGRELMDPLGKIWAWLGLP